MGRTYRHFSLEERCRLAQLQAQGCSLRQIAAALDRAPSSVAREVKRNSGQRYQPGYAQQQSQARRWTGSKLARKDVLRGQVLALLRQGWSPEQVAHCLTDQAGQRVISYETIYRFLYAEITRTKDYRWRHYLPQGKAKRGLRRAPRTSAALCIAHRRPLTERPRESDDRHRPGHWEADLMLFARYGQAILTLHERRSRLLLAALPSKAAAPVAAKLAELLAPLPPEWRQTVTFDNGTEFALHYQLHPLGIQTFFCDPYKPWQKGGIENAIGRLRRRLPRKTDLATLSPEHVLALVQTYNNTPRKCLDFQSPAQFFWTELLHFKCESTFPPSRE